MAGLWRYGWLLCIAFLASSSAVGSEDDSLNTRDATTPAVKVAAGWIASTYPATRPPLADRIAASAFAHAALNGLPYHLFLALIAVESRFDPKARSHEGARGLTQVMLKHHQEKIRGRDLFNPDVAIEVGAVILRDCFVRFSTTERALRCYSGYQGKDASAYTARIKAQERSIAAHPTLGHTADRSTRELAGTPAVAPYGIATPAERRLLLAALGYDSESLASGSR